jgi:hypothetical protein
MARLWNHAEKVQVFVFCDRMHYLGFFVGRDGSKVVVSMLEAIRKALASKSKTQIGQFLGMTGVYLRFISGYANMASAITRYVQKELDEEF